MVEQPAHTRYVASSILASAILMMLPRRVAIAIRLHRILEPGERVVVAVSGGPDSLALLSLLRELLPVLPLHLTVAHFDHGWRPEGERERDFVASLAGGWGFDFRAGRAREGTAQTENAARQARYAFLREVAAATGSSAIALGHNRDDQVETLLLHLLRGSGSRGLAAMRRREGELARPLLDVSRREIEAYLARLHLSPLRDPSNDDTRFSRNRLRKQLLPAIDDFDPAARELLARTADILSDEDRYLEEQVKALPDEVARNRDAFGRLPLALQRRIIRRLVPSAGFPAVESLRRDPPEIAAGDGAQPPAIATLRVSSCDCDPADFKARDRIGHLDADLVRLPLQVVTRKAGDRMRPLGLGQPKRLQDILVDARVPRQVRDSLPLVSDREEIVWIPGVTVAESKRVRSSTRRQLHLEIGP